MPATIRTRAVPATASRMRLDVRAAAFGVAFLLPTYLSFAGGGYDDVLRDEVGLAIWWIVLLGVLVGVLPLARWDRRTWTGVAALAAFAAWTGIAIFWSQSGERSVNELARLAMYLGILVLALATITRAGRRQALSGLAAGIGLVAVLALLSRLHPAWFPPSVIGAFLPGVRSRLAYPLNYWNGLAALLALGVPVTLGVAESAHRIAWRALAAGSLPATAAALFLTGSRGGALALAAGLAVYLIAAPARLGKVATLVNVGIGSAVVVANIAHRPALDENLGTTLAHRQGTQLIAITLLACAGVALVQVGIALAERHGAPPAWMAPPRRRALQILTVGLLATAAVFVAAHGPRTLDHQWQAFKNPQLGLTAAGGDSFQRFGATSGNGRYQFWGSGLDAARSHPWGGIGPGTFEFWWATHGGFYSYLRNAHSLFFETLAETGFIGLALLLLALGTLAGRGLARAVGADPERRLVLAAVAGGGASFLVSAGVDWVWQLPAVAAAFLVLAAIGVGPAGAARAAPELAPRRGPRMLLGGLAVIAVIAMAIPMAATSDLRASQAQAASGHLSPALARADAAHAVEPYAGSPPLQRALVLELERRFPAAAAAAAAATRAEPADWRTWLVRSRIEAERGAPAAALAAYRRARALNPRSPVFAR